MATFKYSGSLRYNDDTQLWKEYLGKERTVGATMREFQNTDAFAKTHAQRFGEGRHQRVSRNAQALNNALTENLAAAQGDGYYKTDYLKDQIDHHTDPAYCIIKPSYRPSMPQPNTNQLAIKHNYSFKAFGDPDLPRANKDIFRSTHRQTLQNDTPYYRELLAPFNVKHALVDPSHTFTQPKWHKMKRDKNLMAYDLKGKQRDTREQQSYRRETIDFTSDNILRLPEQRDYWGGPAPDPVDTYYKAKQDNKKFFRMKSEEKIDLGQFGKSNYLVAKKPGVGLASFKNYVCREGHNGSWLSDAGSRVLSEPRPKKSMSTNPSRRELTVRKYKCVKQMLKNERQVSCKFF